MSNPQQAAIIWPRKFLPGFTDNFVTNEIIAKGLSAAQIWNLLADISKWESYYNNVSQITPPSGGTMLKKGDTFKFSTFGFPVLTCPVEESVAPDHGMPGRLAWSAKLEGTEDKYVTSNSKESVDVYHAWLVEDLESNRVRTDLGAKKPNVMLLGHQDWLEGLVAAARGKKVEKTNLASVEGLNS